MSESRQRNIELVTSFFETLSAGDLEQLALFLHDRATWTIRAGDLPGSGTHEGREGIIDEFRAPVRGLFEPGDPKLEITNVVADGRWVAIEAEGHGWLASGREYDQNYAFVIEVEDGKILTIREYMDTYYVSTVLDVS